MDKHLIFGIHITDRTTKAPDVQKLFTKYADHIKTRIGLHDVHEGFSAPSGLILLEMFGANQECSLLKNELLAIEGIEVQEMSFEH